MRRSASDSIVKFMIVNLAYQICNQREKNRYHSRWKLTLHITGSSHERAFEIFEWLINSVRVYYQIKHEKYFWLLYFEVCFIVFLLKRLIKKVFHRHTQNTNSQHCWKLFIYFPERMNQMDIQCGREKNRNKFFEVIPTTVAHSQKLCTKFRLYCSCCLFEFQFECRISLGTNVSSNNCQDNNNIFGICWRTCYSALRVIRMTGVEEYRQNRQNAPMYCRANKCLMYTTTTTRTNYTINEQIKILTSTPTNKYCMNSNTHKDDF